MSVMASGMGMPSMGIYSFELYAAYNVENIIRIGSIGSFSDKLHLADIIAAMGVSFQSDFPKQFGVDGSFSPLCDPTMLNECSQIMVEKGINFEIGNVLSSDRFYAPYENHDAWRDLGIIGVEMEAGALYTNAAFLGKRALAIASVSNSFVYTDEDMSAEERTNSFDNMIEVALDTACKLKNL